MGVSGIVRTFKEKVRESVEEQLAVQVSQLLEARGPDLVQGLSGARSAAQALEKPLEQLKKVKVRGVPGVCFSCVL